VKFQYAVLPVMINQCKSAHKLSVVIPNGVHFDFILNFLAKQGYLRFTYSLDTDSYTVFPRYITNRQPALTQFRVVSTPGRRLYQKLHQLRNLVYNHRPHMIHYIVSTRKGLMTAKQAYRNRMGGEVIYEI